MKIEIKINKNNIFSLCIAAYYAIAVIIRVNVTLFNTLSGLHLLTRLGTYLIVIIILYRLLQSLYNVRILLIAEALAGILFLISYAMGYLDSTDWLNTYQQIAMIYIPLAIAAYNIINRQKLLEFLHNVAIISTPILVLMVMLSYGSWDYTYDMAVGYIMVFTALILFVNFTIYYKPYDIILGCILCFFILFTGSRGPFVCILSFLVIELILSNRLSILNKVIIIAAISILSLVIILNINNIILLMYQLSLRLGFDSRSLRLLLQGAFISHDSGRSEIWEFYLMLINESPFAGYGIMGNWAYGNYPHNIIIELILSFGYPIGIILFLSLIVIMVNGIRNSNKYNSAIATLFVSYCMLLFISNSYLMVWQFFVCIAFCLPQPIQLKNKLTMNR